MANSLLPEVFKVTRLGAPVLRRAAMPVTQAEMMSKDGQRLVDGMVATMFEYDGIGLAGPQVGIGKTVAVACVPKESGLPELPLTVMWNPRLQVIPEKTKSKKGPCCMWEGCLSIPDMVGWTPRARSVAVTYFDHNGEERKIAAHGFLARVLQHECDHLRGLLYIDHLASNRDLAFLTEQVRAAEEDPRDEEDMTGSWEQLK